MAAPAAAALTDRAGPRLSSAGLDVKVSGRALVHALAFEARHGEFIAVLGRNGVGKTLTLHTLAGLRAPAAGSVQLDGRDLGGWTGRERARRIALLPQTTEDPFPSTVLDTALIGRHPHLPFWQWEGDEDLSRARAALATVGLAGLAARDVTSLSGGERRRLEIATLLAQDAPVCLLDEPTNHLDPQKRSARTFPGARRYGRARHRGTARCDARGTSCRSRAAAVRRRALAVWRRGLDTECAESVRTLSGAHRGIDFARQARIRQRLNSSRMGSCK